MDRAQNFSYGTNLIIINKLKPDFFSANLEVELIRIISEKDNLKPFEYAPGILVKIEPILSQIDQKTENAYSKLRSQHLPIRHTGSQHRCPKCFRLPWEYHDDDQDDFDDPHSFTPESIFDLIFSLLHIDLRCGEGWIRLACLAAVGLSECGPTHPLYYKFKAKMDEIVLAYLNRPRPHKRIVLNKIRPGNKGSSNTGIY